MVNRKKEHQSIYRFHEVAVNDFFKISNKQSIIFVLLLDVTKPEYNTCNRHNLGLLLETLNEDICCRFPIEQDVHAKLLNRGIE